MQDFCLCRLNFTKADKARRGVAALCAVIFFCRSRIQFKFLVTCQSHLGDMTPSQHNKLHDATPRCGSAPILINSCIMRGPTPSYLLLGTPYLKRRREEEQNDVHEEERSQSLHVVQHTLSVCVCVGACACVCVCVLTQSCVVRVGV